MAVNVSTFTSVCLYCKANSNSGIEQDFHEIYDEVGRELQLPSLVEKYFHIRIKNDCKKYLCDDCVNRLIELYDLEEHAKEENSKETSLESAKNVNIESVTLKEDSREICGVEKEKNKQQSSFPIKEQKSVTCGGSYSLNSDILQKEFYVEPRGLTPTPLEASNGNKNFFKQAERQKTPDYKKETVKSAAFVVEQLQNDSDIADNFTDEYFIVRNINEDSQELTNLTNNSPIEIINSSEAESQEDKEYYEDVGHENIEIENLCNTNSSEDIELNTQISSIEDQLSENENLTDNNEHNDDIDDLYEELDETLMDQDKTFDQTAESKEIVIADDFQFNENANYDVDSTTMTDQKSIFNEIIFKNDSSKSTVEEYQDKKTLALRHHAKETDCQNTDTVKYEGEEVFDKTLDDASNDSISLEEEYLIEEISCPEEYDEVDLNEYLDKVLNTKFQDLEFKWDTKCKLCSSNYNTFENLLNHSCIREFEEEQQFHCILKNCEETSNTLPILARHLILNHYDKLESAAIYGRCPDCQKTFSNILDFNKHSCCRNIKRKPGSPNYCQYCDMDFQSLKRYVFHMQFHLTNRRPKICLLCGVLFKTSNDFFEHTQYQHVAESAMACVRCDRFFKEKDVFDQHVSSHDTKYHYSCSLCPKKYTNKFILTQHMDIYHSNRPSTMKCDHCEREFVNRISYRNHIKCHDSDVHVEAFICSTCGIVTGSLDNIKYHIEDDEDSCCFLSHIEEQILGLAYTCENCSLDFHTIKHLKQHRLGKNHKDDLYICGICRQSFKTLRHMRNHCTNHKDLEEWKASFPITRYFVCNIGDCEEFYPIWTTLYYHKKRPHKSLNKSITLEEFKCQFCQQICSSKMSLAVHVARSHNNSNVKCSYCKSSFKSQQFLQDHIDKYHTPVECDICKKKFKHRRNLDSHNNMVHLSIKRYFCKYCAKGYFHKSEKDIHEKKVHPKSSYKCELCNFATTYPESLQVHMDKHNNQLKFKCTICSKAFGRKQLLKCHLKRHLNKKDFKCADYLKEEGCDGTFLTHNLLKRHIQTKHPNSSYNNNLQNDGKLKETTKKPAEIVSIEDNSYELWVEEDQVTASEMSAHSFKHNKDEVSDEDPIEIILEEDDLQFDE